MLGVGDKLLLWICVVDRTMCVSVAGETSDPKAVTSGISQGSVLGPALF